MEKLNKEKIEDLIHKLEGILKTSKDNKQQIRVYRDIKHWKGELGKYKTSTENEDDLKNENNKNDKEDILNNLTIEKASPLIKDVELDQIYTFIKYLDEEYIIALNEYQLKLTFNQSVTRSNLHSMLNDVKFNIESYIKVIEELSGKKQNAIIIDPVIISQNNQNIQSEYRKLLAKIGAFLIDLLDFVKVILKNYEGGGNFILNPNDIIETEQNLEDKVSLNGKSVVGGLYMLKQFIEELIEYFNFRAISQINKTKI